MLHKYIKVCGKYQSLWNISKFVEYIKVCEIKNKSLYKCYASAVGLERSPSHGSLRSHWLGHLLSLTSPARFARSKGFIECCTNELIRFESDRFHRLKLKSKFKSHISIWFGSPNRLSLVSCFFEKFIKLGCSHRDFKVHNFLSVYWLQCLALFFGNSEYDFVFLPIIFAQNVGAQYLQIKCFCQCMIIISRG